MKVLSKKKTEELFDDLMTLNLIASESNRMLMINEKPNVKDLIRTQRIIIERCANAAFILKGMFGMVLAKEIHTQYNEKRLKQQLEAEAKNDKLDEIEPPKKKDPCEGCYYALNHTCAEDIKGYCPREKQTNK
mgnify:CR=1 FL=1